MIEIKDQIKRFFVKIFIFSIIVILLDQLIGNVLHHFYFRQVAGTAYRTTYSIDSTKSDVLVFGSSRANHHYVPKIFEDGLGMSFYNTGRDGNFILYNNAIFKSILSRYIPQIVILDINPDEFYDSQDSYDRLSSLLPYYKNHPEIRSIVNLRGLNERIKLLSAIYPFNSNILTIGIGNLKIQKKRKPDISGYVPLDGKMTDEQIAPIKKPTTSIDTIKIQALSFIAKTCFEKKIKLFICYSPIYYRTTRTTIDTIILRLSNKYNFKYFNFSNHDAIISQPKLFRDRGHLNNEGATTYSAVVMDSIKLSLRYGSNNKEIN